MKTPIKPLTLEERKIIEQLIKEGKTSRQIAQAINRGTSVVKKDINRCGSKKEYTAQFAHDVANRMRIARSQAQILEYSHIQKEIIKLCLAEGVPQRSIAYRIGSSPRKLDAYLKENDISTLVTHDERISCLEMQIKILTEQLRSLVNANIKDI